MSRKHAKHNKSACEFIKNSGAYPDWVITTAYYSALHFMQSELFPAQYENPDTGNVTNYGTFAEYCSDVVGKSKHGLLLKLVEENVDDEDVIDAFTSLKDLCWTARYSYYGYAHDVAEACFNDLVLIEEYCEPVPKT
jgi:hypothetical protein